MVLTGSIHLSKQVSRSVDAHQHFWDITLFEYPWMTPERSVLRRNFLPMDLQPLLAETGVERSVLVQAHPSLEEGFWLLELAAKHDFIGGVVIWVELTGADLPQQLDQLQVHPKFKGVRHPLEAEQDDAWMLRKEVLNGLKELERRDIPFDLVIFPRHLKYVPELREHCPQLRLVVDHLAKPPIAEGKIDEWARDLSKVAQLPGVWCKLSGLITEADCRRWTLSDLEPYVHHAVKEFGFNRLMFGSDWPVCTLAGSYGQVLEACQSALGPLTEEEAASVFSQNACGFYNLFPAA